MRLGFPSIHSRFMLVTFATLCKVLLHESHVRKQKKMKIKKNYIYSLSNYSGFIAMYKENGIDFIVI